jgi:hypothetical protein
MNNYKNFCNQKHIINNQIIFQIISSSMNIIYVDKSDIQKVDFG